MIKRTGHRTNRSTIISIRANRTCFAVKIHKILFSFSHLFSHLKLPDIGTQVCGKGQPLPYDAPGHGMKFAGQSIGQEAGHPDASK